MDLGVVDYVFKGIIILFCAIAIIGWATGAIRIKFKIKK
jgi:hypothetical protein